VITTALLMWAGGALSVAASLWAFVVIGIPTAVYIALFERS